MLAQRFVKQVLDQLLLLTIEGHHAIGKSLSLRLMQTAFHALDQIGDNRFRLLPIGPALAPIIEPFFNVPQRYTAVDRLCRWKRYQPIAIVVPVRERDQGFVTTAV